MKIISIFVVMLLTLVTVTGCGDRKSVSESANNTELTDESIKTEKEGIPDSVKQTLYSVLKQEPAAVPENFAEQPINTFTFNSNFGAESPEFLPVSVNGVTYQSTYDDVVERLGLTIKDGSKDPHNGDSFSVICHTESYRLSIFGKDNLVNDIVFNIMTEN